MSENVYEDTIEVVVLKSGEQMEMVMNVYENAEAIGGHSTSTGTENGNTPRNQQVQATGTQVFESYRDNKIILNWFRNP